VIWKYYGRSPLGLSATVFARVYESWPKT